MYEELSAAFPNHNYFYEVSNLTMADALDRCARLTLDDGQVLTFQNKIVFVVKHALATTDITWLNPVAGSPIEGTASETPSDE